MAIRSRLTLIRLALIRNPWSYGEEVSRLLYRYLYLHLLFRPLQQRSSATFVAVGMLPYLCRFYRHSMSSAPCVCPIIIHAGPLDYGSVTHSLNEWLLPSQHPSCRCDPTSLLASTRHGFRGLRRWSELFLSRTRTLAPAPLLPGFVRWHSVFVRT